MSSAAATNPLQRIHAHIFPSSAQQPGEGEGDGAVDSSKQNQEVGATYNNGPSTFQRIHAHLFPQAHKDETIRKILHESRTIALVGASSKPESPSHCIMDFMQRQGYHVIPVNPGSAGKTILGQPVVASLADIEEPIDTVHVFRKSEEAGPIVDQAIDVKAKNVWLQVGVTNDEAGEKAKAAGLDFVQNVCPRMEIGLMGVGLVNNDHTIRKILTETKNMAIVGISQDHTSHKTMEFAIKHGYHVIPVNADLAGTEKILGHDVVATLEDVEEPIDGVMFFGSEDDAGGIVEAVIEAKVKSLWFPEGLINDEAGKQARSTGLDFVQNVDLQTEIDRLGVGLKNNDYTIRKMLAETKTIALVGASSNPEKPSHEVMDFLIKRGYQVIPVNPTAAAGSTILGQTVVASLKDIEEPIDMVHVFRPSEEAVQIVEDAIAINAKSVWLQIGVINDDAGKRAREAGLDFCQNLCPKEEIHRLGLNNESNVPKFLADLAASGRKLHEHFFPKRAGLKKDPSGKDATA